MIVSVCAYVMFLCVDFMFVNMDMHVFGLCVCANVCICVCLYVCA